MFPIRLHGCHSRICMYMAWEREIRDEGWSLGVVTCINERKKKAFTGEWGRSFPRVKTQIDHAESLNLSITNRGSVMVGGLWHSNERLEWKYFWLKSSLPLMWTHFFKFVRVERNRFWTCRKWNFPLSGLSGDIGFLEILRISSNVHRF